MAKRIERLDIFGIGRIEGLEVLKAKLGELDIEEIRKTAKSRGYSVLSRKLNKEQTIEIILTWVNKRLNHGTAFVDMTLSEYYKEDNK